MPHRSLIRDAKAQAVCSQANLPRKVSRKTRATVPQTDTGRRDEKSKANGKTLVKELGKMSP